ncbi:hypothetical protein [Aldersonia kunmingensis]|uniref:hypothetical protein n=1 Tax=Aldersonia kunmingensis TaxID=408066 RepID=UPI0012EE4E99|nr:hypothetical protein [Aldersonia kunmingensis]
MTALATLIVLALFATAIFSFAPRSTSRKVFRLDQFRPAAPLAGLLPADHDKERLYADLLAVHAREPESSILSTPTSPVRRNWTGQ